MKRLVLETHACFYRANGSKFTTSTVQVGPEIHEVEIMVSWIDEKPIDICTQDLEEFLMGCPADVLGIEVEKIDCVEYSTNPTEEQFDLECPF